MPSTVIQFFTYEHLPEPLRSVSKMYADLAHWAEENLPDGPEKSMAQRRLLEAKDCAVRTMLDKKQEKPDEKAS